MIDDQDKLNDELNWRRPDAWRDRRWFKTDPNGVNVMNGIAAVLWLLSMVLVMKLLGEKQPGDDGVGRIVLSLVMFTVCAFICIWLSRRIWVAIGSVPRAALRPFGILGPLPIVFGIILGYSALYYLLNPQALKRGRAATATVAPAPPAPPPLLPGQRELKLLGQVEKTDVPMACSRVGPGWELATEAELARAPAVVRASHQTLANVQSAWVMEGATLQGWLLRCSGDDCSLDRDRPVTNRAWVFCAHSPSAPGTGP